MKTLKKLMTLFLFLFIFCSNCIILDPKHNPTNENNIGISTNALEEYTETSLY